jgi:hypothetical protein
MLRVSVCLLCGILLASVSAQAGESPQAKLDWMQKAYGDGSHNAFTDLIQWKGLYYLCFRHGEGHVSMDGEIRIVRSPDLKTWEPCGTVRTIGDDRDPHFAATEERLFVYFGVWDTVHGKGRALVTRNAVRSHVSSTADGTTWRGAQGVYESKWWMWRVKHHGDAFYSVAYSAFRPAPKFRETRLLRSEDGLTWNPVSTITQKRMSGESDMWFHDDGSVWVLSRTGVEPGHTWLHESSSDRKTWVESDTGQLIHSPVIAKWKDRFFVAGRGRGGKKFVTKVWELVDGHANELITLPSGGDTSYPGLLVDPASLEDGQPPALFVSWYSQHDQKSEPNHNRHTASVYVGRVVVAE